jgi:AcrR family transcriptional regulator
MKRTKSDTYHHGNLPEACIAMGLKFFAKGETDFSLRKLASAIGVSHGAPAKHFGSKEGLVAAIAERGFEILSERLRESQRKSLKQSFQEMGRSYVSFGLDHSAHYRAMLGDKIEQHQKYPGLVSKSKLAFGELVALVERAQNAHQFRKGNSFHRAYCIWSGVHGLVNLAIDDHVKLPQEVDPSSKEYPAILKEHCLQLTDDMTMAFFTGFSSFSLTLRR